MEETKEEITKHKQTLEIEKNQQFVSTSISTSQVPQTVLLLILLFIIGASLFGIFYYLKQQKYSFQSANKKVSIINTTQSQKYSQTSLPPNIANTKLIYVQNNDIYLLDSLNTHPRKLPVDYTSDDLIPIAYNNGNQLLTIEESSLSKSSNPYEFSLVYKQYDINTGDSTILKTMTDFSPKPILFSPDSKYISIGESWSDPTNHRVNVYSFPSFTPITTYDAFGGGGEQWLNNSTIITQYLGADLGFVQAASRGIEEISIPSGKVTQILPSTPSTDYTNYIVKDNIIYYIKDSYKPAASTPAQFLNETYWKMNIDGTNNIQIKKSDFPTTLATIVQNLLPSQYKKYVGNIVLVSSTEKNWVVFTLNNPNNTQTIAIINIHNASSFRILEQNAYAIYWGGK